MFKRVLPLIVLLFLLPLCALAQELSFTVFPSIVRPGKTERISFYSPVSGAARLEVLDASGNSVCLIRSDMAVSVGVNHLTWDGMNGASGALPAGEYTLSLTVGSDHAQTPVTVGQESPQILSVSPSGDLTEGSDWQFSVRVNMPGSLTLRVKLADDQWHTILETPVEKGESNHRWDGLVEGERLSSGRYAVQLKLTDQDGFSGTVQQVYLTVIAQPTPAPTPAPTPKPGDRIVIPSAVTTQEQESNYWTLPVGKMDEAAIWEVMMQPIVVIDGNQKEVYRLLEAPNSKAAIVGEITYASQGVHILETRDDGWTLVEVFNSSYGPKCASRPGFGVTDDLIQGYVKTSLLKTITPRTDYGLLIDKLEQTMYIFSEGKCIGSLLVSTGLNNKTQSWNETPSGEFLMVSRMGGFNAGNLYCDMGMRVNGGCAIHEVPYIGDENTPLANRDYSASVKLLGKKASHGCIRVQRAANEQGQNIKWLWDNIKVNTKVLIWDDTGRFVDYPDDSTPLYYNPVGGKYFHENQYCPSVRSSYLPLTAITYGDLDTTFSRLTPCSKCVQIMTKAEIDAMNKSNGF